MQGSSNESRHEKPHSGQHGQPFWLALEQCEAGLAAYPDDFPLHALILIANRVIRVYWAHIVQVIGLKISLPDLCVLQILAADDGLKSSEIAARAASSPGTVTVVVNTLVRDGFVEREPDEHDRHVVRLHITGAGREAIASYTAQSVPLWRGAFEFVRHEDEAVMRRALVQ